MFLLMLQRDFLLAFRRGGGAWGGMAFYAMLVMLAGFSVGVEALRAIAPGLFCLGLALAGLMSLPSLFERDLEDGTLEQLCLQPVALEWLMLAKLLAHWASNTLPLIAVTPFLALMADVPAALWPPLLAALLLLGAVASVLGAIGAALSLGKRHGHLLQALVILPLLTPPLIFASAPLDKGGLWLLAAALLAALPLACLACAALVRAAAE